MSGLKKLTAVMLSVVMLVCCFTVSASAAGAIAFKSGKSTTAKLSTGETATYKFSTSKDGEFVLSMLSVAPWAGVNVVDTSSGELFIPKIETDHGFGTYNEKIEWTLLYWDSDNKPLNYKGTLTYFLPEGTYYLKIKTMSPKEVMEPAEYDEFKKQGNEDEIVGNYTFKATYSESAVGSAIFAAGSAGFAAGSAGFAA